MLEPGARAEGIVSQVPAATGRRRLEDPFAGDAATPRTEYFTHQPLPQQVVQRTREIARYRHLVRYLVSSSLRTENTGTVFGFVWWILDPLLLMAIYTLFIGIILKRGGHAYPVFVLSAIIAWEFFVSSVRSSMGLTLSKARAMRQIAFPKGVIPLSATLAKAAHLLFAVLVLILFALPFGIYPSPYTLLVVPIAAVQLLFTLGVGYFLAALNFFFRDTDHLTGYVFRFWFYLSPALYPPSMVPKRYGHIFELNPFYAFFDSYRRTELYHELPNFGALGIVLGVSILILVGGYTYFTWSEPQFAKLN